MPGTAGLLDLDPLGEALRGGGGDGDLEAGDLLLGDLVLLLGDLDLDLRDPDEEDESLESELLEDEEEESLLDLRLDDLPRAIGPTLTAKKLPLA